MKLVSGIYLHKNNDEQKKRVDSPAIDLSVKMYIQGVPGGMCQTSGECSLC
jgi:hypothetical protein